MQATTMIALLLFSLVLMRVRTSPACMRCSGRLRHRRDCPRREP